MATPVWDAAAPSTWSTPASWTDDTLPIAGDGVTLDVTGVGNCTLDVVTPAIASLVIAAGYTGTFDSATFAVNIDGDCTLAGTAVDLGTSIWTIGGSYNDTGVGTLTIAGSTIVMTGGTSGTPVNFTSPAITKGIITIAAGAFVDIGANFLMQGVLTVNGVLDFSTNNLEIFGTSSNIVLGAAGSITGTGTLIIASPEVDEGIVTFPSTATIDVTEVMVSSPATACLAPLAAGAYGGALSILGDGGSLETHHWASGTYSFGGAATYTTTTGTGGLTVDAATNDPDITFSGALSLVANFAGSTLTHSGGAGTTNIGGALTFTQTAGTVTWTRGSGVITFDGAGAKNITTLGQDLEAIVFDGTGSTWTIVGELSTADLTVTAGTVDFNGQTIGSDAGISISAAAVLSDLNGVDFTCVDFTIAAPAITAPLRDLNASAAWTITASEIATITRAIVTNLTADDEEVVCTDCIDGGGNTNVAFLTSSEVWGPNDAQVYSSGNDTTTIVGRNASLATAIRITSYMLSVVGAQVVTLRARDDEGATRDLASFQAIAGQNNTFSDLVDQHLFVLAADEDLILHSSAAGAIGGHINYERVAA